MGFAKFLHCSEWAFAYRYRCACCQGNAESLTGTESSENLDEYQLRLDVCEQPVNWPLDNASENASDVLLRSYSNVRRRYERFIDQCRFEELCAVSRCRSTIPSLYQLLSCRLDTCGSL